MESGAHDTEPVNTILCHSIFTGWSTFVFLGFFSHKMGQFQSTCASIVEETNDGSILVTGLLDSFGGLNSR